jgi:hypothetical protein
MFKLVGYVFAVACFSSSLAAYAGCPEDLRAAQRKFEESIAAQSAALAACKKVKPVCSGSGPTKAAYDKWMLAGAARSAADKALADVKKRCAQAPAKPGENLPPPGRLKVTPGAGDRQQVLPGFL